MITTKLGIILIATKEINKVVKRYYSVRLMV